MKLEEEARGKIPEGPGTSRRAVWMYPVRNENLFQYFKQSQCFHLEISFRQQDGRHMTEDRTKGQGNLYFGIAVSKGRQYHDNRAGVDIY